MSIKGLAGYKGRGDDTVMNMETDKRFKRFTAHVVALGKSYECDLFAETAEDANKQAERYAPIGTTSITIEAAPQSFENGSGIELDIEAALDGKHAELKKIEAIKPMEMGEMVTAALAAKDKLIATLTMERNSLRDQLINKRR